MFEVVLVHPGLAALTTLNLSTPHHPPIGQEEGTSLLQTREEGLAPEGKVDHACGGASAVALGPRLPSLHVRARLDRPSGPPSPS